MKAIWKWLNGNKTLFGTLILVMVQQGVFGPDGLDVQFFTWLGGILAGGGIVHKALKGTSNN